MSICEGCIKQDVCKYKEEMERGNTKENLVCRYKKLESVYVPSIWDNTTYIPETTTIPYPDFTTTYPYWLLT